MSERTRAIASRILEWQAKMTAADNEASRLEAALLKARNDSREASDNVEEFKRELISQMTTDNHGTAVIVGDDCFAIEYRGFGAIDHQYYVRHHKVVQ